MNPVVSLLLNLAHTVAPKHDKVWLNDMRLEAAFVANKLSFALAALGLAFRLRFAALKFNRPLGLAFGSVALAALATFFFIPRLFGGDNTTHATMSSLPTVASESAQDLAEERGYSVAAQEDLPESEVGNLDLNVPTSNGALEQVPAQPQASAPEPADETTPDLEIPDLARVPPEQDIAAGTITPDTEAAVAEVPLPAAAATMEPLAQEPVAIPAPTSAITPNPDVDSSTAPLPESSDPGLAYIPEPEATGEAASTPQAAITIPAPATPAVDTEVISTQVTGESVVIEIENETMLTLYRDTNFSGSPRLNRFVTPGETFTANVPFSLYTDNAAAIKVTLDGESFNLGEVKEEQFRIFSKP